MKVMTIAITSKTKYIKNVCLSRKFFGGLAACLFTCIASGFYINVKRA